MNSFQLTQWGHERWLLQTLELWTDGGDECGEALAEALVHIDAGRRDTEQQLEDQWQTRLDIASEHRTTAVGDQRQRM